MEPTVLIVPGLRDHVPEHWQTLLEQRLPRVACVPRRTTDKLSCAAWIADVDRSLAQIEGPVILGAGRFAGLGLCLGLDRGDRR